MLTPDGRWALSLSGDDCLALWDFEADETIQAKANQQSKIENVALTPDGKIAVLQLGSRTLVLWDLELNKQLASFTSETRVTALACTFGRVVVGDSRGQLLFLG